MAKGSGRRRYTPADGLKYDPETETTTLDKLSCKSVQSMTRRIITIGNVGAPPTKYTDYGSHTGTGTNGRYGGRGRKNDFRCWKTNRSGVKAWDRPEENKTSSMEESEDANPTG